MMNKSKKNSMDDFKHYITREKLKELKQDYEALRRERKAKVENESTDAFHSEELSAEFVSFHQDLDYLDIKIHEIEQALNNFEIIKPPIKRDRDKVGLGANVQIKINGKINEFDIVDTLEANPSKNRISNESPIGRAIFGKKVGETAVVKTPDAVHSYKIVRIRY